MAVFPTTHDLYEAVGAVLGPSRWREVSQTHIDRFADIVDDHQWIHVDVDRARGGPFGSPVAHGMLTVGLVPTLVGELVVGDSFSYGVNYGFDRVRFIQPVPSGALISGCVEIVETLRISGGVRATFRVTVDVENATKPACVADNIVVYYD